MLNSKFESIKKKISGSDEKDKNVAANILGSFGIKGMALVISFLSMPLYISFFDSDQVLGVWFTILAVMAWLLSFDLGIGNGLRNKLVYCFNEHKVDEAKKYISSAYILYSIIAVIMIVIGLIILVNIDLNKMLAIAPSVISSKTITLSVVIIYIAVVMQLLLKLITSIMYSLQQSTIPNVLALITSLSQFLFVLLYKTQNGVEHKFLMLSIVYLISVNLPLIIATIVIFKKTLIGYSPKLRYYSKTAVKGVLLLGGVFFWVQIMFMLFTASNEMLIMSFFGSSHVVQYSIYNKLYTLVPLIMQVLMTPYWSAITKANAQGDYKWLDKTLRTFSKIIGISIVLNCGILLGFGLIVKIWIGDVDYIGPFYYSATYFLYAIVFVSHIIYSTFACGLNDLSLQFKIYTAGVIIKLPFVYIMSRFFDSWLSVIIINIIVMSIYSLSERHRLRKYIDTYRKGDQL